MISFHQERERKKTRIKEGHCGRHTLEGKVRQQLPQDSVLRRGRRWGRGERGEAVVVTNRLMEVFQPSRKWRIDF